MPYEVLKSHCYTTPGALYTRIKCHVPLDYEIFQPINPGICKFPSKFLENEEKKIIYYYPWIQSVLFFCGFVLTIPRLLWKTCENNHIENICSEIKELVSNTYVSFYNKL